MSNFRNQFMKVFNLYIVFIFININFTFSQEENPKTGWKISERAIIRNNQEAIFVVNGNIVHKDIMEVIEPKNIESLNVLKGNQIPQNFENAKKGVILITTKNISKKELKKLYQLYPLITQENLQEKKYTIVGTIYDCEKLEIYII